MTPAPVALETALAGRYRIERELGAGGMARVYLAHDVRHDRRVALKVLRPELAAVVGAQRFLAEIKTTANLQHPHILPLFDSGEVDGTVFYVMPFVDGESLRDRLAREHQLPIGDAVRLAREVAEALHHAHGHGVIHRDIKPENILLQGGHALVADFGIALAASNTGGTRMTESGISLGTPTYMSPEQAMGERTLDARTDVYALGCVLYEMLAGEPPFTGPSAQSIVARVMTEEPRPLTAQRKTVPQHVVDATEIALARLPADRFATAADFASALAGEGGATSRSAWVTSTQRRAADTSSRTSIALAAGLALAATLAIWGWLRPQPERPVRRAFVKFADAEAPSLTRYSFALLPDGSGLVYVGKGERGGGTQLWMKKLSELHATPLGGTSGARHVFVSPDGKWLGFLDGGTLKKVPVAGGVAIKVADAACRSLGCVAHGESGAWLDDGRIAFVSSDAVLLVDEDGGPVDSLMKSVTIGGTSPILPTALPGSRGLLFTACTLYCNKTDVMVVDLATRRPRVLVENASFPQYLPTGHLLFVDGKGVGMVAPFDVSTLELTGTSTPVLERVSSNIAVSNSGVVAYLDGDVTPRSELVLVGRNGQVESVDSTWRGNFATLALGPDGTRIAASIAADGDEHLWLKTLKGGPPTRLTIGKGQNTTPTWSADGSSLFFTRFAPGATTLLSKRADGTGPEVVVQSGENRVIESAITRDGSWLVTREYRNGARDIYARRLGPDSTVRPVVSTPWTDVSPALSPNGKYMAYTNDETGRREMWVVPFPDAEGARWQVSTGGAIEPTWSHDGTQLFYVNEAGMLMSVDVSTTGTFSSGNHHALFDVSAYRRHPTHRAYEVLPGSQRFLMIRNGAATTGDLVLVDNWFAELATRLRR